MIVIVKLLNRSGAVWSDNITWRQHNYVLECGHQGYSCQLLAFWNPCKVVREKWTKIAPRNQKSFFPLFPFAFQNLFSMKNYISMSDSLLTKKQTFDFENYNGDEMEAQIVQ